MACDGEIHRNDDRLSRPFAERMKQISVIILYHHQCCAADIE